MSAEREGPSRAEVRAASKRSAKRVVAWNQANLVLTSQIKDVIVTLEEIKSSEQSTFGPTVQTLTILGTLIPGAPTKAEAVGLRKLALVGKMLEAAYQVAAAATDAIGGLNQPGDETDGSSDDADIPQPASFSVTDWDFMREALAKRNSLGRENPVDMTATDQEGFSDSSDGDETDADAPVVGVGRNSMLYRYRNKEVGSLPTRDVFDGVTKDLAAELVYVEQVRSEDPTRVRRHYAEILNHLPMMLKRSSLRATERSRPGKLYVGAMESFLHKHRS